MKKDKSKKLAMDLKTINKAIHKNKYQMHNIDCLMDNIAQTITQSSDEGEVLNNKIDKTLYNLTNTFSFLDDILIVTGGGLQNHKEKLFKCLDRLNEENLAINLNKCPFAKKR